MYPFGVTYYPDQWPKETWDETFKQIKEAGFNIVRFAEMAWDWLEPQCGKLNFKELDQALDLCRRHEIKVLLGIPTSQVPTWFFSKHPGSQPVAQDGTKYPEYGPRPNICKDNPHYRHYAERLLKKVVARYHNHPAVMFWQVDNEPVYPPLDHTTPNDYCHCQHSRQAFIAWAKKKYGNLKKLNEVWGAKFWTNTFSDWQDIQTPKAGIWEAVSPHIFLDWYRFKSDRIQEWVSHLAKLVRQIDPFHKVGTNGFIGICTRGPEHNRVPVDLDWYGLDVYPTGGNMTEQSYEMFLDLWRSFVRGTKAEFHLTELQGGQNVRWGNPKYVKGPELKGWTETALKHGARAILYHAWRPPLFGAETAGFGILKADGSKTKRLEVIEKLAKNINEVAAKLASPTKNGKVNFATTKSSIAIGYLRNSEVQTYQEQGPPRSIAGQWEAVRNDLGLMHGLDSISGAHKVVYKKGEAIDFVFDKELTNNDLPYKVILLPNPYLLSKKQYQNLKNWVKIGGTLITEARFGLRDENGHLYPNPLLEDLLGVTFEYTEPDKAPKGFFVGLERKGRKQQIITKKIGKGKVVYANFSIFLEINNGSKKLLSKLRPHIGHL